VKGVLALLLFLLFCLPVSAEEVPKTLLNLFRGVKTAEIVFSQKTTVPVAGDEVTLYKGEIFYKRPLKFLWRYTWGSRMFIVSDGEFIETVFDDGSCQVSSVKGNLDLFPLLLLAKSPDEFLKEFTLIEDLKKGDSEVITFKSKSRDSFFREISFLFEGERLKELKAVQSDGTEERFRIEEIRLNVPLKDSLFQVKGCKPAEAG